MLKGVLLPTVLVALWGASVAARRRPRPSRGTVSDQTGAVLPGVVVVARHAATGATKTVATTDTGRYNVPFLPVGSTRSATRSPASSRTSRAASASTSTTGSRSTPA